MNKVQAKTAFRTSLDVLAAKVNRYDEWGPDPEVAAIRTTERRRRYRAEDPEKYREKDVDRRLDARIKALKAELAQRKEEEES